MAGPRPGLAFSMPIENDERLVGLYTHEVPRHGSLVWIAEPTFGHDPTLADVASIKQWRWPVLVPLAAAIRSNVVTIIGEVPIPIELARFPTMRSGDRTIGWVAFTIERGEERILGPTSDRTLPIDYLVNATALREMVSTNWRPENIW